MSKFGKELIATRRGNEPSAAGVERVGLGTGRGIEGQRWILAENALAVHRSAHHQLVAAPGVIRAAIVAR